MSLKVGIFFSRLQEAQPRGVVRVARAICERLALSAKAEYYVIGDPLYACADLVAPIFSLDKYLATVPMVTSLSGVDSVRRYVSKVVKSPSVVRLGKSIGHRLRFYQQFSRIYRTVTSTKLVPTPGNSDMLTAGGYWALNSFDAILSFEAFEDIWDWPLELFDCKKVGFFHDAIPLRVREGINWKPDLYYRATGRFVMRADHIICNSYQSEKDLNTFFPTSLGKTSVAYLGHDLDRFSRARLQIPKSPSESLEARRTVTLTMVGDYDLRKNVSTVLRSMPILAGKMEGARIRLMLIGKSSAKRQYAELQKSCSRFAEIVWLGYLGDDDLARQLSQSDAFLYPSLWEGFGIPVLEAMSAGVPVVCSNLSSLPEVGGEFAYYCDPYDANSIAVALHKAVSIEPAHRAKLADVAAGWAAGFTWSRTAEAVEDTIRRLIIDGKSQ